MALTAGGPTRRTRGLILHALFRRALRHSGSPRSSISWRRAGRRRPAPLDAPRLPIAIAGVVFNIAPAAIRVPVQRRAGPQDRVDLAYVWPDLTPAGSPRRPVSLARLFVTIEASQSTHAAVGAAQVDLSALCRDAVGVWAGRPRHRGVPRRHAVPGRRPALRSGVAGPLSGAMQPQPRRADARHVPLRAARRRGRRSPSAFRATGSTDWQAVATRPTG